MDTNEFNLCTIKPDNGKKPHGKITAEYWSSALKQGVAPRWKSIATI
jgi:hypothetical protein